MRGWFASQTTSPCERLPSSPWGASFSHPLLLVQRDKKQGVCGGAPHGAGDSLSYSALNARERHPPHLPPPPPSTNPPPDEGEQEVRIPTPTHSHGAAPLHAAQTEGAPQRGYVFVLCGAHSGATARRKRSCIRTAPRTHTPCPPEEAISHAHAGLRSAAHCCSLRPPFL